MNHILRDVMIGIYLISMIGTLTNLARYGDGPERVSPTGNAVRRAIVLAISAIIVFSLILWGAP